VFRAGSVAGILIQTRSSFDSDLLQFLNVRVGIGDGLNSVVCVKNRGLTKDTALKVADV
jgi:hypothetical protein